MPLGEEPAEPNGQSNLGLVHSSNVPAMTGRVSIPVGGLLCLLACAPALSIPGAGEPARGSSSGKNQPKRVRPAPRFQPGQTLRYQMEFRTVTRGRSEGPVENPQAPSELELSVVALLRLEVLSISSDAAGRASQLRLRSTYEKLTATTRTDSFDPQAAANEEQYRKLEGHSFEFTLDADGKVVDVGGLDQALPDEGKAVRAWLAELSLGASLPREGILPGQKWFSEQPLPALPLMGMTWRNESTYLRNEPCHSAVLTLTGATRPPGSDEVCAVILTRSGLAQHSAPRDPTPEDYRKRGLRTAGKWSGSSESLSYLSLRTGLLMSVTQTSDEDMDVTVATADGESRIRYTGRVRTQSQITLISESPITPRQP